MKKNETQQPDGVKLIKAGKLPAVRPMPQPPDELISLLRIAVERPDIPADKLNALLEMKFKVDDRYAKREFDAALADMQGELPVVIREGVIEIRKKDAVTGERTGPLIQSTKYAKWEDINEELRPVLVRFGFALRFNIKGGAGANVEIIGILSHKAGHREISDPLILSHDATGSKNAVQAIGSAVSYGKRYVAGIMLNFSTKGEDDDAASTGGALIVGEALTAFEVEQITEFAKAQTCPLNRLAKHLGVDKIELLPRSRFDEAIASIESYGANKKSKKVAS